MPSVQPHKLWPFCVSKHSSPTLGHADVRVGSIRRLTCSDMPKSERVGSPDRPTRRAEDESASGLRCSSSSSDQVPAW